MRKLPEVAAAFWVMKICATTLGETAGDLLSMTLGVGYATSSLILIGAFVVTLVLQLGLFLGAALAPLAPARLLLVARYYVVTNWGLAAGLWDWLRGERSPGWETVEGTR